MEQLGLRKKQDPRPVLLTHYQAPFSSLALEAILVPLPFKKTG